MNNYMDIIELKQNHQCQSYAKKGCHRMHEEMSAN